MVSRLDKPSLVRRATYAWVRSSVRIRPMADHVQGGIGLSIAAAVEAVALSLTARRRDRTSAAHHCENSLRNVVGPGFSPAVTTNLAGDFDAHAFELEQSGREFLDQRPDKSIKIGDLVVEVEDSAGHGLQGKPGRDDRIPVADGIRPPGRARS